MAHMHSFQNRRLRVSEIHISRCLVSCCSVLQCVAVCCSVLQCVAVCCSVSQRLALHCNTLQYGVCPHNSNHRQKSTWTQTSDFKIRTHKIENRCQNADYQNLTFFFAQKFDAHPWGFAGALQFAVFLCKRTLKTGLFWRDSQHFPGSLLIVTTPDFKILESCSIGGSALLCVAMYCNMACASAHSIALTRLCMYACIYMYVYMRICTYGYVSTYTYIYINIRAYICI